MIDGGARVITVQTNNATYGGTPQPEQQLAIERVRATEFGRSVVVAATSGISAVIAPDSTVVQRLDEGEEGWLVRRFPARAAHPRSPIGHVVELLLCAVALAAVAVAAVSASSTRRRRRAIA